MLRERPHFPHRGTLYAQVGNDLPTLNGNGEWVLPIPATYLIDAQGRVALAHVEADDRERAEPQQVLDRLLAGSRTPCA